MTRCGDVVIVDLPFTDTARSKIRPAVIVQNDADNKRFRKTVVAMITGNLRRKSHSSHLLVDPKTPDGASSGLAFPSLVSCINLFTVEHDSILQVIGHLSDPLLLRLRDCLRSALELH